MHPEHEESVRRLLAAAASGDETVPPEVAARLDARLEELVAERSEAEGRPAAPGSGGGPPPARPPAPVRHLRPRRWPRLLAAAAAVSVVAVGLGELVVEPGGDGPASQVTAGRATADDDGGEEPSAEAQDRAGTGLGGAPETAPEGRLEMQEGDDRPFALGGRPSDDGRAVDEDPTLATAVSLPPLRSATLRSDVQRLVDRSADDFATPRQAAESGVLRGCRTPATTASDRLLLVRLDGRLAVLVLGPAAEGRRPARIFACARASAPVAETRVTAADGR